MTFSEEYTRLRELVESRLELYFTDGGDAPTLTDAMRYSVLGGGKRVRAVLALAFCNASGGDEAAALDAACAIELLHAYSLIHDDLPALDNDDMRRGKPSNHKAFGEWRAIIAGDALQTMAFEKLTACSLPSDRMINMVSALSKAAGAGGMCAGQTLDMEAEENPCAVDISGVRRIHELKTAALIEASALIGVYAAGGTAEQINAASEYARAVGMAFQIRDDVLDGTATSAQLGKPSGSDAKSGKFTFLSELGAEKCEELIAEETKNAKRAVSKAFANTEFLSQLADELAGRES